MTKIKATQIGWLIYFKTFFSYLVLLRTQNIRSIINIEIIGFLICHEGIL